MAQDPNVLAGNPDVMTGFAAQGPTPPAQGTELVSRMVESGQFAAADQRANRRLADFATTANQGVQTYNATAAAAGMTYLTADEESSVNFAVVADPVVQRAVQGPTLTQPVR